MTPEERTAQIEKVVVAWAAGAHQFSSGPKGKCAACGKGPKNAAHDNVQERLNVSMQFLLLAIRGGARCVYCEMDLRLYDSYTVRDHVIPRKPLKEDRARWAAALVRKGGGIEDDDNMVLACRDCNYIKRQYMPKGETFDAMVKDAKREIRELRSRKAESWAVAVALHEDEVGRARESLHG